VTILAGHYGSGKTNIAVNMALNEAAGRPWKEEETYGEVKSRAAEDFETAAESGKKGNSGSGKERTRMAVADLDIVNPYFRTEDSRQELEEAGIRLICSMYANSNVDLPSMPEDLYAISDDKNLRVLIDVGGDDRGALALGRLSQALIKENDYEMLMVLNCYRPLTRTAQDTITVMKEIEQAARLPFTGLINNSNLGRDTEAKDVLSSLSYAREVEKLSGLPLLYTTVEERIFEDCRQANARETKENRLPGLRALKLQKRPV